ncbi:AbrB/MazE/SpoVT family DNA-binding domain-containing protein [Nitrosopumilus sp.]|uniref:AbrB/MazE/SpoVT family DNA-binding domain-containing protein n=1 Tax=Nitrosopumilus sp. TaxID=2024843 RepID=UPI00261CF59E|nr:AbrB/MazE/SpoVT family DNA-binding domain-containing protein [Nitrosopumilus sp.]
MKLQKQVNRKVGNKEYSKLVVVIPPEKVDEAGWEVGDELEAVVKRHEIILKLNKKK